MLPSARSVPPRLRFVVASLLGVLALLTTAQPAAAFEKSIWGPAQIDGKSQFPVYKDLGVDLYQRSVNWAQLTPTRPADPTNPNDPAYLWGADPDLDLAIREASASGISVLLMPWKTPEWANGGLPQSVPPTDPDQYAMFVEALAKRYPQVHHWMVWGEPIRTVNYAVTGGTSPNYYDKKSRSAFKRVPKFNATQRRQARGYAGLVDATYQRVKTLNRSNLVVGGNSTTSGDVDPFNWARYVRLSNGKPPRMDLYGHNPFGTRGPDLKKDQLAPGTADFSDLDVFIPWMKKYQSRAGRNKKLKLFISEYSAPTDVFGYEFNFYVTRKLQAQWLNAAFKIAKRSKDIAGLGWFSLIDMPKNAAGQESRTGLITLDGVKKPSYYAFKRQ